MANITPPATTEIDAEQLMARIQRRVKALPDAQSILTQVDQGRLYADGIYQTPTYGGGFIGKMKSQIARVVLRAVRGNLYMQTVFNHAVVDSLQLIAEDLQALQKLLEQKTSDQNKTDSNTDSKI